MYRIFDFKCYHCGKVEEMMVKPREHPLCCGIYMEKLLPIININMGVGAYGYYDETLGKPITTNKQHREEMQKQGVTPKGDTPKVTGEAWV